MKLCPLIWCECTLGGGGGGKKKTFTKKETTQNKRSRERVRRRKVTTAMVATERKVGLSKSGCTLVRIHPYRSIFIFEESLSCKCVCFFFTELYFDMYTREVTPRLLFKASVYTIHTSYAVVDLPYASRHDNTFHGIRSIPSSKRRGFSNRKLTSSTCKSSEISALEVRLASQYLLW